MEKFEFVKCTILWKFNGKWCTLDIQMVRIRWKFVYNRCTKSQNSGKKLKFRKKNWICWKYEIIKIQQKTEYVTCRIS